MEKKMEKTEERDILDDIKQVQRAIRAQALVKAIAELKKKAKLVLETKEEILATLEALGLEEKEQKKVIDFVNSLPEVQLSQSEKKEIREEMREQTQEKKEEIEQKIHENDKIWGSLRTFTTTSTTPNLNYYSTTGALTGSLTGTNTVSLANGRQKLEVKI